MSSSNKIIIGSRGSELALWQSNHVKHIIETVAPEVEVEIIVIKTTGDHILDSPLSMIGGKGLFTAELEEALIAKHVDLAVHSLKDLPTEIHPELTIAAIPERADVRDAYLGNEGFHDLDSLPLHATVATGSLRRKAQLLAMRPDLNIIDIRGNVPTRVKKLRENNWHGMILASAGLTRLSLAHEISEYVPQEKMLPAPGQGALAIECRASDEALIELLRKLDDPKTRLHVEAERTILSELGGGCQLPLGTYAYDDADVIHLSACVADTDGSSLVKRSVVATKENLIVKAKGLASELLASGAKEILAKLNTPTTN